MSEFPAPVRDDGFVLALPSSPTRWMECSLVSSLTAPSWLFRVMYDPDDSGSYDWQVIGGVPMYSEVNAQGTTASTTYGDCTGGTTAGPTLTLPFAGDWDIWHGMWAQNAGNTVTYSPSASVKIGAAATADSPDYVKIDSNSLAWDASTCVKQIPRKTAVAASTVIKQEYKSAGVGVTSNFERRWLMAMPARIG